MASQLNPPSTTSTWCCSPGRNEIDDTQELNYPAIIRAIEETGYTAYLGQEFVPKRKDKLVSLKQGVEICTV